MRNAERPYGNFGGYALLAEECSLKYSTGTSQRIKIRTVLLGLTSGVEAFHEGAATREDFDAGEFLTTLRKRVDEGRNAVAVVESFIDAELARATKELWPSHAVIVFIDADENLRARRLEAASGTSYRTAHDTVARKDARKHVYEQLTMWRQIADYSIENTGSITHFKRALDNILVEARRGPLGESGR